MGNMRLWFSLIMKSQVKNDRKGWGICHEVKSLEGMVEPITLQHSVNQPMNSWMNELKK